MDVRNNPAQSRYELFIDGELVGVTEYVLSGDVAVMPHTEIAPTLRGHGLGAVLVRGALDDLRGQGKTVVPQCSYVAQFIGAHPEYSDLLAA